MTRTFHSLKAAFEYAARQFETPDREPPPPPIPRRHRPRIVLTVDRSDSLPAPGTLTVDAVTRHGTLHVGNQRHAIPFQTRPELVDAIRQLWRIEIVGYTSATLDARKYLNAQWRLQDAADNPGLPEEIRAGIRQLRRR